MADKYILTTFQFRRGLAENWKKNNPILAQGEPGFERDTYRLKIGDGVTAWNDLAYFEGTATIQTDNASIEVVDGVVSLNGFSSAGTGYLAMKGADGKLNWTNKIDVNMLDVPEGTSFIIEDTGK